MTTIPAATIPLHRAEQGRQRPRHWSGPAAKALRLRALEWRALADSQHKRSTFRRYVLECAERAEWLAVDLDG